MEGPELSMIECVVDQDLGRGIRYSRYCLGMVVKNRGLRSETAATRSFNGFPYYLADAACVQTKDRVLEMDRETSGIYWLDQSLCSWKAVTNPSSLRLYSASRNKAWEFSDSVEIESAKILLLPSHVIKRTCNCTDMISDR